MNILAIISARNDAKNLRFVVPYLRSEGVDVVVLDNDSDDDTADQLNALNSDLGGVERIHWAYPGYFDLTAQLRLKSEVIAQRQADWIIHQDADEIIHQRHTWGGLRNFIERADHDGFSVINCDELVMLPRNPDVDDPLFNNSNFYFFEPHPNRLMRIWKGGYCFDNQSSGGHSLVGNGIRQHPENLLMKHFIVRSQRHALDKYLHRAFSPEDLAKGWHGNRMGFTEENLRLPKQHRLLHSLSDPMAVPTELPRPVDLHYWQWPPLDFI